MPEHSATANLGNSSLLVIIGRALSVGGSAMRLIISFVLASGLLLAGLYLLFLGSVRRQGHHGSNARDGGPPRRRRWRVAVG